MEDRKIIDLDATTEYCFQSDICHQLTKKIDQVRRFINNSK